MGAQYLIRLDDACPTMDHEKWGWFEDLFDEFNIKPIIAVVPKNDDPLLKISEVDPMFWEKVRTWQAKGYEIALHGYDHVYITQEAGLVPLNNFSEFAGVPLQEQKKKIREGINVFEKEGISTRTWVAPGHSFDYNTLIALNEESNINIISDGISLEPFYKYNFLWVPQQLWGISAKKNYTWTICYHPNIINEKQLMQLKVFLEHNKDRFIRLQKIFDDDNIREMTMRDGLFNYFFWGKRNFRKTFNKGKYL